MNGKAEINRRLTYRFRWGEAVYLFCLSLYVVSYSFMREVNGLGSNGIVNWQNYMNLLKMIRVLLAAKIVYDAWEDHRILLLAAAAGLAGTLAYRANPDNFLLPLLWFGCAGRHISKERLIQVLFWSHLVSLIGILCLYGAGYLPDGKIIKEGHSRVSDSLGFYHPNTAAAKIFQLVLIYWIIGQGRSPQIFYPMLIGLAGFVYWFSECWTVIALLMLLGATDVCKRYMKGKSYRKRVLNMFRRTSVCVFLGGILVNFLLCLMGGRINFKAMFGTFGVRLTEGYGYLDHYGLSLWGQPLINHNSDPELAAEIGLYTLDNAYMHLLIAFGTVFFVMFVLFQLRFLMNLYENQDWYGVVAFFLYFLFGFMETQLIRPGLNFMLYYACISIMNSPKKESGDWQWRENCSVYFKKWTGWAQKNTEKMFETVYLCFLAVILLMACIDTTMFIVTWPLTLRNAVCITLILTVLLKTASEDRWEFHEIVIAGVIGVTFAASWHHYMRNYVLELAALIIGARGISAKKILKTYVFVSGVVVAVTVFCSLCGRVEDLTYLTKDHGYWPRHSFGFIYPTDCAAHFLYLSLAVAMFRGTGILWGEIVGFIILGGISFFFCGARTNAISLWLLSVLAIQGKKGISVPQRVQCACQISAVLAAVVMIVGSWLYDPEIGWMKWINSATNNRLLMGHEGFQRYLITLLGQEVLLHGYGGSVAGDGSTYFFLDSSYVNVLLQHGLLVLFVMLFLMYYISKAMCRENMIVEMMILSLVAVNCMMEHHLIEVAYNPFFYLALANLKEDNGIIKLKKNHEKRCALIRIIKMRHSGQKL